MTGYFHGTPRPLLPDDAESVRALVWGSLGITPYVDRVIELLSAAERGDPESRALVAERDGTVAALALFGPVSGTRDTWHLSIVIIAPRVQLWEVGRAMIDGVVENVRTAGARLLVAEFPADAVLGRSISLLRANGFREEGRVRDFYRDGVARLFLRREL